LADAVAGDHCDAILAVGGHCGASRPFPVLETGLGRSVAAAKRGFGGICRGASADGAVFRPPRGTSWPGAHRRPWRTEDDLQSPAADLRRSARIIGTKRRLRPRLRRAADLDPMSNDAM